MVGNAGDQILMWGRPNSFGRIYFGFSASATGCDSFVMSSNTNDIRFQSNPGFGNTELNSSTQSYVFGRWYELRGRFHGPLRVRSGGD